MSRKAFSSELEETICHEYESGLSTLKLAAPAGSSWSVIYHCLKRNGITCRSRSHQRRIYSIDENCFDVIDSAEQAYFLGLLYADGGNTGGAISLQLIEHDRDILERLNLFLGSDKPLLRVETADGKIYLKLLISNKKLIERLDSLGVCRRKTFLIRFPSWLDSKLYADFVRGYLDGDGSISIDLKRRKCQLSIVSNRDFCLDLKHIVDAALDINTSIQDIKGTQAKRLVCSGNRQSHKLLNWLYGNASTKLSRKFEKYLEFNCLVSEWQSEGRYRKRALKANSFCRNCSREVSSGRRALDRCHACYRYLKNNGIDCPPERMRRNRMESCIRSER